MIAVINPNDKGATIVSPSSSFYYSTTRKDDPGSPDSISSSASQSSNRLSRSFSFTPRSTMSFVNPAHDLMKQREEKSPQLSTYVSLSSIDEKQNKEQTDITILLNTEDNNEINPSMLDRSISSDKHNEFNSSVDSFTSLIDDVFTMDKLNSSANTFLPSTLSATPITQTSRNDSRKVFFHLRDVTHSCFSTFRFICFHHFFFYAL